MAETGELGHLPLRELKKLAQEYGVPAAGGAADLASRLEKVLPAALKEQTKGAFLETKRAFSYRFYRVKRGGATILDLTTKLRRGGATKDPFQSELRPPLTNTPEIYRARLAPEDVLYLSIAFSGDPRTVQDGWREFTVTPPVFAVVAIREKEKIVEIRGRWEKVTVIEEWLRDALKLNVEHVTFSRDDLDRLKRLLCAKLASQTLRPQAGNISSIRIVTGPDVDLDEAEEGKALGKVFSRVGVERRNPGFIYHPTDVRVRANEHEGSFYIPKHATEDEVRTLRHAFRVTMGLLNPDAFVLPTGDETPARHVKRPRLMQPAVLQEKLNKLKQFTASERRTILNVLRSLQLGQQARIFPGFWKYWIPERDGHYVANQLCRVGVLRKLSETQCPECEYVGPQAKYPATCPDCRTQIPEGVSVYRVRGFLEPAVADADVFQPDYVRMAELYRALESTRGPQSRATNDEKKRALEEMTEFLLAALDGFTCVARNVRTSTAEVDSVFRNTNRSHALLQRMGENVRVECKNIRGRVGTRDLAQFIEVLRKARSRFGVYVAMDGFSGIPSLRKKPLKLSDCALSIRDAFSQGITVLLLDGEHIKEVATEGRSLVSVLWKACEFVASL